MQTDQQNTSLAKYTKLEALGILAMGPKSTNSQFNTYRDKLTSLTQQLKMESDPSEAAALARAWVPLIRFGVTESTSPSMYHSYIKIFTGLLINNRVVHEFTKHRSDVTLLEGLVMMNTMLDEKVTPGKRFGASEIIEQWLGEKLRPSKMASLESVVNYLYGPLTWDIYNNGETQSYRTIHALLKERLPIIANQQRPMSTTSEGILPGDMTP